MAAVEGQGLGVGRHGYQRSPLEQHPGDNLGMETGMGAWTSDVLQPWHLPLSLSLSSSLLLLIDLWLLLLSSCLTPRQPAVPSVGW